jgi:hypothetical protein
MMHTITTTILYCLRALASSNAQLAFFPGASGESFRMDPPINIEPSRPPPPDKQREKPLDVARGQFWAHDARGESKDGKPQTPQRRSTTQAPRTENKWKHDKFEEVNKPDSSRKVIRKKESSSTVDSQSDRVDRISIGDGDGGRGSSHNRGKSGRRSRNNTNRNSQTGGSAAASAASDRRGKERVMAEPPKVVAPEEPPKAPVVPPAPFVPAGSGIKKRNDEEDWGDSSVPSSPHVFRQPAAPPQFNNEPVSQYNGRNNSSSSSRGSHGPQRGRGGYLAQRQSMLICLLISRFPN